MTLSEKLQSAESEYHDLMTGNKARVIVDQNGERVEFTVANAGRLAQYIESLRKQINGSKSGPMRVFF